MNIFANQKTISDREFINALKIIPVIPEYINYANFLAYGIDNKNEEYVKKCLEKRVIPHSSLGFNTSGFSDKEFHFSYEKSFSRIDYFGQLISGGKIHRISFVGSWLNDQSFDSFISKADMLLDGEYTLNEASISLTYYQLTGYNQGTYPDSDVVFRNGSIQLENNKLSEENQIKINNWIQEVKR